MHDCIFMKGDRTSRSGYCTGKKTRKGVLAHANTHTRKHTQTQTYVTGVLHLIHSILLLEMLFRKDPVNRSKRYI